MRTLYFILITFTICRSIDSEAQADSKNLSHTILYGDSLFWMAYNQCDVEGMAKYFTEDVEFYHDKGGITSGLQNEVAVIKKNLCGNENFRLRREAVKETIDIFPMRSEGVIYGAIISGEHNFYIIENEKERLDGHARFLNLWILKEGVWKMSRILSYDHGPVPYKNQRKTVKLDTSLLNQCEGRYKAQHVGICMVERQDDQLQLSIDGSKYILYPESNTIFFVKDRDLTFEFARNTKGKISKLIIRENGKIVEEADVLN
jgi:hypothetical protein